MVFSSLIFLYGFLPANLLLYFICKNRTYKNIVLICFSMFFYAWGEPVFILLLLFYVFINYIYGILIEKRRQQGSGKIVLAAAIITDLGLLGFFKYYNFIAGNLGLLLNTEIMQSPFGLPIGISFYTFQILSYVVDVYRGHVTAQKKFYKLLLYVSMYHQLIAGPIVRYADIEHEIDNRVTTVEGVSTGINRFATGLAKKVLLANTAGSIATVFMDSGAGQLSILGAWFGILMYTLQIYFDFSGYSDMAIGLGRIFGFTYKENFDHPYAALDVTGFWRRWHMSLSSFFRDYVYIPLGGNRRHQIRNILIVWGLTGLWHGASWNFLLWGLYYGVLLIIEKKLLSPFKKLPSLFRHVYLLVIVAVGWVFFYYTDIMQAVSYLKVMFGLSGGLYTNIKFESEFMSNVIFFAVAALSCTPLASSLFKKIQDTRCTTWLGIVQPAFNAVLIIMSTAALVGESYNPFLYFRF